MSKAKEYFLFMAVYLLSAGQASDSTVGQIGMYGCLLVGIGYAIASSRAVHRKE